MSEVLCLRSSLDIHVDLIHHYQPGHLPEQAPIKFKKNQHYSSTRFRVGKQQSTNYAHKTKDRVTRTPVKTGSEHICSGRVGSFCSTSSTRGVNLVIDPVISHE
jgi:hypothetical protein